MRDVIPVGGLLSGEDPLADYSDINAMEEIEVLELVQDNEELGKGQSLHDTFSSDTCIPGHRLGRSKYPDPHPHAQVCTTSA